MAFRISTRWAMQALFFATVGCGGGSGDAEPTKPGEPPPPEPDKVEMACAYTGGDIERECEDGIPCPKEVKEGVCYADLMQFLPAGATGVNNWEKDGLWESRKGKWALFTFEASKIDNETLIGRARADISVKGDLPETVAKGTVVYGVGKFKGYKQGLLSDDLIISDAKFISEKQYAHHDAGAALFAKIQNYKSDTAELRFGDPVQDLWAMHQKMASGDVLSKQDIDLIYFQARKSPEAIEKAAAAAEEKRQAKIAEEFDSAPFLRLQAIAKDEDSKWKHEAWALPTTSKCGTEPRKGDLSAQAYAELKGNKDKIQKRLMTTYRKMSLSGYSEVKVGDYDSTKKAFPVTLYTRSFSMSGKSKSETVDASYNKCCELLRPGVFKTPLDRFCTTRIFGCKSNEAPRTFSDTMVQWHDETQKKTFYVKSDTETAEWTKSLKVEAVVRPKRVNRICRDGDVKSSVYAGEIRGLQFLSKGKVIDTKISKDVTTAEAQMGPDAWVEAQLKKSK